MLVICLYQCSRKLQANTTETADGEYLTFKSLQGLQGHDLGKIFIYFLVGCQEKKKKSTNIQASEEYAHDYSTCTKKRPHLCYLLFGIFFTAKFLSLDNFHALSDSFLHYGN